MKERRPLWVDKGRKGGPKGKAGNGRVCVVGGLMDVFGKETSDEDFKN